MPRETEGEFVTLYRGLLDDECKFYEYFRMSQSAFCDLLMKVKKYNTSQKFVIHHSIHIEVPIENRANGSKGWTAFDHARDKLRNIGGDRFFCFHHECRKGTVNENHCVGHV